MDQSKAPESNRFSELDRKRKNTLNVSIMDLNYVKGSELLIIAKYNAEPPANHE